MLSTKKAYYTRLFSESKKEERQVEILDRFYLEIEIIKAIGNRLKFKRKITWLLKRVHYGQVEAINILYNDRLGRCGFGHG